MPIWGDTDARPRSGKMRPLQRRTGAIVRACMQVWCIDIWTRDVTKRIQCIQIAIVVILGILGLAYYVLAILCAPIALCRASIIQSFGVRQVGSQSILFREVFLQQLAIGPNPARQSNEALEIHQSHKYAHV